MQHNPDEPQTLEEMVARYGRALAVIDESTGELKVMGMGGAHSVNFDGKPKPGVKKPKGDGFDPNEDPDNQDEEEYDEKELKVVEYLNSMEDEEFASLYPEENDAERAEELKWLFDTGFAFARRALTNRRKGKKKRKYKEVSDETEIKGQGPCWPGYKQVGMKEKGGKMVPNCVKIEGKSDEQECCPEDNEIEIKAARKRLKDPKGGLTAAGRAHFKRKEGANLKPGVKGAADTPEKMRRKGSFLTRFFTNPSGPMKDEKGRPTRLALSAAAWGEPVPQNASDAAELAAKGRRMLERYENAKKNKKKDAWDDVEVKQGLGPTIGQQSGTGGQADDDEMVDKDGDGKIFDGTPDERPAKRKPYEKMSNSYLEKRRRRHVNRELRREGITPTRGRQLEDHEYDDGSIQTHLYGRSEKEKNARTRARETFNQDEDRKRFVRNQLRKRGIAANAKKADRSDEERAARREARAEYDRRVRAGEPKKPKTSSAPPPKKPDTSWQDNEDRRNQAKKPDTSFQDNEDRRNRGKSPYVSGKPADRYGKPSRQSDGSSERAEEARQRRIRAADRSNQRVEDARNRGKRPIKPVDRFERPEKKKKPRGFQQGDMV